MRHDGRQLLLALTDALLRRHELGVVEHHQHHALYRCCHIEHRIDLQLIGFVAVLSLKQGLLDASATTL